MVPCSFRGNGASVAGRGQQTVTIPLPAGLRAPLRRGELVPVGVDAQGRVLFTTPAFAGESTTQPGDDGKSATHPRANELPLADDRVAAERGPTPSLGAAPLPDFEERCRRFAAEKDRELVLALGCCMGAGFCVHFAPKRLGGFSCGNEVSGLSGNVVVVGATSNSASWDDETRSWLLGVTPKESLARISVLFISSSEWT